MSSEVRRHHGNRHGRSEAARAAVLEAADDLLAEKGFAGVTIEGIAARAGVAKQTIYRWWPSKVEILLDALGSDMVTALEPVDSGDLSGDLRRYLRRLARFLTGSDPGAVLRALVGQAQHDPDLAARLRVEHLQPQREREAVMLREAIARGELPAGFDVDLALDRLVGAVYYRVLVTGEPVPVAFTDGLVAAFVAEQGQSASR
ncbi:TetR/AcrR family transcriptional regulator [Cryptosporangium sp. NPDC048952]|uniref:TetR/AcrR family transcriptional regulator n=1 Tax=Cryptosporangium sp. NPDC048952 TaxID=3363961 RepID=UPI003720D946